MVGKVFLSKSRNKKGEEIMEISKGCVRQIKGRWYYDVRIDGQRKRGLAGETKGQALACLEAMKTDARRGENRFTSESKILFKVFAEEYMEYSKANKRAWERDEWSLHHLIPYFGPWLLSKITAKRIEEYKAMRINQQSSKTKKSPKAGTINREIALLKNMFSMAIQWEYMDHNPAKGVKLLTERPLVMRILKEAEIKTLIDEANGHMKAIITIALNCGLRRNEILNLRWNDVDFDNLIISIWETKNNTPRKVPMNALVLDALHSMDRKGEYIFTNTRTGERIKDIKTGFKAACRRAEIQDLRFHDLRHNCGTQMVMNGVDIVTVKEILGHKDIRTTLRYCHPTPENKRKAVSVLASLFGQRDVELDNSGIEKPYQENFS